MLPDRALSGEGRPIHDTKGANADSPEEVHPPALQPRHSALARLSFRRSARRPGASQAVAKRGVSRAFKWHHIRGEGVAEFGTPLPGAAVELEGRAIMINIVMVFGWARSPRECTGFAWTAKWAHERRRPPRPRINDAVRFTSKWLMDDGIIVEPRVGLRPRLSAEERDAAMRKV